MRRAWFIGLALALLTVGCQQVYCSDTCRHAFDGECDDGRPGAATGLCGLGTDCSDCGANPNIDPPDEVARPPTIPGTGRPTTTTIPPRGTGSSGSCACAADLYCALDADGMPVTGGGGVTACADQLPNSGSVATPCTTASMNCPGWNDSRIEYVCDDREQGVGCYAVDNEYCDAVGVCASGTRNEGETIEFCARMPEFVGHFDTQQNLGRLLFRVSECEAWYQVGSARASCGACADACDVFLNDGPNPCEMDTGPGPGEFDCGNGEYISASRVCNGTDNCGNGRDERSSMCNSESGCCTATRGCPGETGGSCASSCCCCPGGQRCCDDWSRGCCAD